MQVRYLDFYTSFIPSFDLTLASVSKKPLQLQEIGLSSDFVSETTLAQYYRLMLWSSFFTGADAGILTWDFCDFNEKLAKENPYHHKPYELNFGSFTNQYKLKPSGKYLHEFIDTVEKYKLSLLQIQKSAIFILLPEDYLEYRTSIDEKNEMTNDMPLKRLKLVEYTLNTLENQNKALFSCYFWLRMGKFNPQFIISQDISNLDPKDTAILIPNCHILSQDLQQNLAHYVNQGGYLYLSSHMFFPQQLFSQLGYSMKIKWEQLANSKPEVWVLNSFDAYCPSHQISVDSPIFKFREQTLLEHLELYKISHAISLNNSANAQYVEQQHKLPMGYLYPSQIPQTEHVGCFFFLNTSPEIFHTKKRKIEDKEQMHVLYQQFLALLNKDNIPNTFYENNNPYIISYLRERRDDKNNLKYLCIINHQIHPQQSNLRFFDREDQILPVYQAGVQILKQNEMNWQLMFDGYGVLLIKITKEKVLNRNS